MLLFFIFLLPLSGWSQNTFRIKGNFFRGHNDDYSYYDCTSGLNYWKSNSSYGPAPYDDTWSILGEKNIFYLSLLTNVEVLSTIPNGNVYYMLAKQYLITKLNMISGSTLQADVSLALAEASSLFSSHTPAQVAVLSSHNILYKQFLSLTKILEDYNAGLTGPGICPEEFKTSVFHNISEIMKIYPNPLTSNATIEYAVAENSTITVELYNFIGEKSAVLFDQMATGGSIITIDFFAEGKFPGAYIVAVRNGSHIEKQKIIISK